ncbi:MAG: hypothetical protein QM729_19880 [Solirubrobacterales bacterium]
MSAQGVGIEPTVGDRLGCPGCGVEVIVIRPPKSAIELTCGGEALVPGDEVPATVAGGQGEGEDGTLLGKRYAHADSGLELLCTKPGPGVLAVAGEALEIKAAKSLPSSD